MKHSIHHSFKRPRFSTRTMKGLAVSAAIHATLWLALFHNSSLNPKPKSTETIAVELIEPGQPKGQKKSSDKLEPKTESLPHESRVTRDKARSKTPTANDDGGIAKFVPSFRPTYDPNSSGPEVPSQGAASASNGNGFGSATNQEAYRFAEGLDLQGTLDVLPFFDAVWTKIDRSLAFPDEFVKQRRSGTVTIQFEVDHQGKFTGKVFEVRSDEPLLATYALVVLIQSLRSPVSERLWLDRPKVALEATFLFKTYPFPDGVPEPKNAHPFKNYLAFDRHAYAEPWIVEKVDRFVSKYVPPIIPIPGGVYIDFVQAYKMYKAWTEPDPVDVRKQRMDLLVERLRSEIDRAENAKKQPGLPTSTPSS